MNLALKDIIDKYSIKLMLLFGSQARGEARPDSDSDIAVKASKKLAPQQLLDLALELDKFFKEAEVVDIRCASPLLLAAIADDAKCIYQENEGLLEEFKIFAFNQYMDFKPVLQQQQKNRIKEWDKL